ncbi:MAG: AI-2E family transporter [Firmicutes bacterium]|nr:AI-2E family transporter [Bacillota bacterium]
MNDNQNSGRSRNLLTRAYFKQGLAVFLVGLALILVYYSINHLGNIKHVLSEINGILMPFYLGIIMAYLLCPIYNFTVRFTYKRVKVRFKKHKTGMKLARVLGTVVSLLVIIVIVAGLIMLIIPSMYESISTLVPKLPGYFNSTIAMIESHLNSNNELSAFLTDNLDNLSENIYKWAQDKLIPASEVIVSRLSSGIIATIGGLFDCLVALIICVYILNSKELFMAQGKKLILALFNEKQSNAIFELGSVCNETFGGFINGKVIDSFIIGVICFICMTLMKLPMAMLISVIVGVTNIIPFFGPFIGAVPSALLLVIMDPVACLKFIIMVVVLQQVDGNIIGPKILGKSTKLSSFWVMFAIIVGGSLFGVPGMILGVPVFAVIYIYIAKAINRKLDRKTIESDTLYYEDFSKYGIDSSELLGEEDSKDGVEKAKSIMSKFKNH